MAGWSIRMDANRNADPSLVGEMGAIRQALDNAGMKPGDIRYVNPHGSGSVVGDSTELQALQECGLAHAAINTTKSITGHGLTAAGTVEVVATLLQFESDVLHPSRNLDRPIEPAFDWVTQKRSAADVSNSLNLSFGFGGINTALCMSKVD
jgi:malonyl-ACP decarboxylase